MASPVMGDEKKCNIMVDKGVEYVFPQGSYYPGALILTAKSELKERYRGANL